MAAGAPTDGRGHVSRALAVAGELSRAGANVELELHRGSPTAIDRERMAAGHLRLVEPDDAGTPVPDAVVLDLPDLAGAASRFDPGRLVVFDDGGTFAGRAAIVIQPSLPDWSGPGSVGRILAGYRYAPIAAAYRRLRAAPDPGSGSGPESLARVLVCFGGSDPADVLGRIGPSLTTDPRWTVEVVVGSGYEGAADAWSTPLTRDPADLPERLARADLAVIGAGTMKFEVACLGRPAILLAVADDQLDVAPVYARTGAADYLGDGRTTNPDGIRSAVARLLADAPGRAAMAATAAGLIDGEGAARIAVAILDLIAGGS